MSTPSSPGTILLIDDDDMFLRVCAAMLRRAGFTVEPVSSSKDAIERIRSRRYDAIISDIRMPGADGLTVLKEARASQGDVPVVLMTGLPTVETAMIAVQFGAVGYLQKPFDVEEFTSTVQGAISGRPPQEDTTAQHALMDRALQHVWMAYQPIVRWSERKTAAFEALVRSNLPEVRGPAELLALAEKTNRLADLGRVIREKVAAQISELSDDVLVFVNLHPADLNDAALFDPEAPLSKCSKRVVLEITERASVAHLGNLDEALATLRKLGYRIAIDDLGAGYAGLSSLAQMRPEFVKLDATLVRGLPESLTHKVIVSAVLSLCVELKAEVIAEAIETEAERNLLVALGVEWMQGYYFARPSPPFIEVQAIAFEQRALEAA